MADAGHASIRVAHHHRLSSTGIHRDATAAAPVDLFGFAEITPGQCPQGQKRGQGIGWRCVSFRKRMGLVRMEPQGLGAA